MAYLNYVPTRVAGVNFCFFIAATSGGGCWYYAKCEILLYKIEHAKLWIFCKIAKLRWWRHAPRLMAATVATDSRRRFSKRYVADIKNITGDDHATLIVDWNSADIAYTFRFYVILRLWDRDCCFAAVGSGSCHGIAPSFFEEMTRYRHQKYRDDDQATLMVDRNSANIAYIFRFYVCLCLRHRDWCFAANGNGSCHVSRRRFLMR